jgi:hypothetical protein
MNRPDRRVSTERCSKSTACGLAADACVERIESGLDDAGGNDLAHARYDSLMPSHPQLVPLTEGRFIARCQFCKAESIAGQAVDAAHAWGDLERLGWTVYVPVPGALPTALCKPCTEKNERIMTQVARAKKHRRRN